jgi:16S rRNA (guanine966-N2)-methyltransferase
LRLRPGGCCRKRCEDRNARGFAARGWVKDRSDCGFAALFWPGRLEAVTRVIAGAAGGRTLRVPPGNGTRPTSDRAREGLFASLTSEFGDLDHLRVLDLYAGSGAVGLEALSRGAARVLLVESDARAAAVIKANVGTVDLPGAAVAVDRVERLLGRPPDGDRYDLVFADPPYAVADETVARVLTQLTSGWLADGALVVVERATRSGAVDWPPGYAAGKSRRYGEATFWYGWYGGGAEAERAELPQQTAPRSRLDAPHGALEE